MNRLSDEGKALNFHFTEGARLALLGSLGVDLFIFPPLHDLGYLGLYAGSVIASFSLVAGAIAVGTRKRDRWIGISVAILSLVVHWFHRIDPTPFLALGNNVFTLLALGTFGVLMVIYTLGKERNIGHRLVGAIVSYLLLGVIWARCYMILLQAIPCAIELPDGRGDIATIVYFSFATLTTLGYGTPVHPVARSLAMFEALAGVLYPAIFIARLFSVGGRRGAASGERDSGESGER